MEELSLSKNITNYIIEKFTLKLNSRGNVSIDEDFSLTGSGSAKSFAVKFLLNSRSEFKNIDEKLLLLSDTQIIEELKNTIPTIKDSLIGHIKNSEIEEVSNNAGLEVDPEAYFNLVPVIDMEDSKGRAIMVDNSSGRMSPIQEKSWERVVGAKHVATVREIGYCGSFEYNPYSLNSSRDTITSIGREIMYNKYIPPAYKLNRDLTSTLDPRFITFIEGLFQDGCRPYALNWLYYSTIKRLPTYLLLVGAGGIGKNLLAEALKFIHGPLNFVKAPPSALDTKFNGHLIDCTMIYYDECKFSAGAEGATIRKNKLKEWANDSAPVEVKGIDPGTKDLYGSAVIATNNDSDVYLEQLDRKFSAMELTDLRLEKRLGVETTQFLWEYIKSTEFPDAFINWIKTKIDLDFNVHIEYKGPKFKSLTVTSLYTWQAHIRERVLAKTHTHLYIETLKDEVGTFPYHLHKVEDFLKNYLEDDEYLGTVVSQEGRKAIKINEKFCPAKRVEHNLDELGE